MEGKGRLMEQKRDTVSVCRDSQGSVLWKRPSGGKGRGRAGGEGGTEGRGGEGMVGEVWKTSGGCVTNGRMILRRK